MAGNLKNFPYSKTSYYFSKINGVQGNCYYFNLCNITFLFKEIRVYTGHEEEEDVSLAGRRKRTEDCLDRNDQFKRICVHDVEESSQSSTMSSLQTADSQESYASFIPGLTSWRFYEAKRHANIEGPGLPVNVTVEKREKINANSLDHFIDFITSSHIMKDLPYGQRTLKLDSGEIINIPNVIRSLSSSSLISQYLQLCEEDNISPLGKSTLYKILSECAASVRKSVEGLDNYVMEGSRAFQTLEEIFMDENNLKTKLLEAKRYLKADFKNKSTLQNDTSLDTFSQANQCYTALFGICTEYSGIEFQLHCQHIHSQHCQSCIDLDETLQKVLENAEKSRLKIKMLLCLRSKNQEFARKDIADNMEINDVIITSDWAMKFLPRRYREGQLDWFAKRGINWHVSVSLIKLQHRMQTLTHLHIFSSQTSQDAAVTTCGPCDRRAAHAKFVIKRFINEGRDVTSALDMKKGPREIWTKAYRVRVVDTVLDLDAEKHKESIKNVSNFYNFNFADDGLRMWQAYNIGEGKLVQWDSLKPSKNAVQLKVISDWTDIAISDSYEDPVPTTTKHKQSLICPLENCIREFKNKETLDQHILQGQCEHQLEKRGIV
ncbi:unnamed protein product [Mytilus coruscus]|uniref:C2H2-type domain-containing protein n=1 Tax=Mytilus coruscus TaxID=42192 RepID=A0A6J8D7J9_MYTCO|nr:unnamed protein product [Mytilus coruscus]